MSRACLSYRKRARGAALVPALLIVAIAAGVAAGLASRLDASLQNAIYRRDEVQARLLAQAALDAVRSVLEQDDRNRDTQQDAWALLGSGQLPVEGGTVTGSVRDAQGFFNINNLIDEIGSPREAQVAALTRLAAIVGVNEAWPMRVVTFMAASASRGAIQFAHLDELRRVPGTTDEDLARLKPFIVTVPRRKEDRANSAWVNVNTASAEVIAAFMSVSPSVVKQAFAALGGEAQRDIPDVVMLFDKIPNSRYQDRAYFTVASRYFLAEGRVQVGRAQVSLNATIKRDGYSPSIVSLRMTP